MRALLSSIALGLIVATTLGGTAVCAETTITIGVPELPKDLNVLSSEHPGAVLLRRALVGTLRDASKQDSLALQIADSVNTSADGIEWRFRVSPLARFSNGRAVTAEDVRFSLARCLDSKRLTGVRQIDVYRGAASGDEAPNWVAVRRSEAGDGSEEFLAALGRCPIVDRVSTEIFGRDLGSGGNFVSCGEYALSELKAGREISMRRMGGVRSRTQTSGAELLSVRGFADSDAALAALRAGTVDAFLTSEANVVSRSIKDETLFALQCPIYTVVHRRGLKIDCLDKVLVSQIRYVG